MSGSLDLPGWVHTRLDGRSPGPATSKVLAAVGTHPRQLSYASTGRAAEIAGVNAATVVRAAHVIGFRGWPQLRSEIRSRYLSRLSASQVLGEHEGSVDAVARATLRRDIHNLRDLSELMDEAQVSRVAQLIFDAPITVVLGSGSFAAPGLQLAHLAQTVGHDVRLQRDMGTALFNAVALLRQGDALVVFQMWRTPWDILHAMRVAHDQGVRIVLIGDQTGAEMVDLAEEVVLVPSEGSSMFPSLVAPTTIVQAVVASLVATDREGASRAADHAEHLWDSFGLFPPTERGAT